MIGAAIAMFWALPCLKADTFVGMGVVMLGHHPPHRCRREVRAILVDHDAIFNIETRVLGKSGIRDNTDTDDHVSAAIARRTGR